MKPSIHLKRLSVYCAINDLYRRWPGTELMGENSIGQQWRLQRLNSTT